jgi:hypothetical protein
MIEINWLVILASALIPIIIGYLWYGKLFDQAWRRETGMTVEQIEKGNMAKIYGFSLLFAVFFAVGLLPAVIHQMHIYSSLENLQVNEVGSETYNFVAGYMEKYGTNFRTFQHGALHGFITVLFIVFPALATNALFEHKSWKYIFINVGYWAVCATIMGGVISAWA